MAVSLGPKIPIMVSAASGDAYLTQGNAFLRAHQPLLQCNVINMTTFTPPPTPNNGDTYVVAAGATGVWVGHVNHIAYWTTDDPNNPSGVWEFFVPAKGWQVVDQSVVQFYLFNGAAWNLIRQTLRVAHVVTAGEEAAGFAVIAIAFAVAFADTNYSANCTVNDLGAPGAISIVMLDIHNKTNAGFDAVVLCGAGTTGESCQVNVIAIHD
jgi:Protein of unknown function (DUF2793)